MRGVERSTDRAERSDDSRPSYDGPAAESKLGFRFSRAEERIYNGYYDAVRDVEKARLRDILAFIDAEYYDEMSSGLLHEAAVKWRIDGRRLLLTFMQSRELAKDRRDISADSAFDKLTADKRFRFCAGARELQYFVNRVIKRDDDCQHHNLQQLDRAICKQAKENFIDFLESSGKEYPGFYAIELLSAALAKPRKIIDVAFPDIIHMGLWHGHARVLAGLETSVDATEPEYGGGWITEDFEEQIERSIKLDDEQRERDRIYFEHVEEVIRRGKARRELRERAAALNGTRSRLPRDFRI
jgi:hypothetical protein